MIKQTITYTNAFDDEVTEDFYFNFTLMELVEQLEVNGLQEKMDTLVKTENGPEAYKIFKTIVIDAYGVRTAEGGFDKSPDVRRKFEANMGLSEMIIGFLQDEGLGVAFVQGLLPKDKMDAALARAQARQEAINPTPGLHVAPTPQVQPTPITTPVTVAPVPATDETAAYENRTQPVPQTGAVADMSTAEKRQYTAEELQHLSQKPAEVVYTDAEVLAMDPQELVKKGLMMRAYQLKSSQ